MEIIVGIIIVVIVGAGFYLSRKPKAAEVHEAKEEAPYKVEAPVETQITDAVTQEAPAKKPRAKKAPAAKKTAAKKTTKKSKTV